MRFDSLHQIFHNRHFQIKRPCHPNSNPSRLRRKQSPRTVPEVEKVGITRRTSSVGDQIQRFFLSYVHTYLISMDPLPSNGRLTEPRM